MFKKNFLYFKLRPLPLGRSNIVRIICVQPFVKLYWFGRACNFMKN